MNKLFVLTLVAVIGCASASPVQVNDPDSEITQLALFEDDQTEVGDSKSPLFNDFCIDSRDHVRAFLKDSSNTVAMKAFNVMFNNLNDIGIDAAATQKELVKQATEEIQNAGLTVAPGEAPLSHEELEEKVEQSRNVVERKGLLGTLSSATMLVVKGVLDTLLNESMTRLAKLKAQFNGQNLRDVIDNACETISGTLKGDLANRLETTKKSLLDEIIDGSQKAQIEATKIEDVGCVTTTRIARVAKYCAYFKSFGPVVYPLLFPESPSKF